MSDERALVPAGQMSIAEVMSVGATMAKSGFFSDAKDANKAIVKILAGREMGFGPFASMTGINIIKGKPAIGGNLMAAAVKNHPKYNYQVVQMEADVCELAFFEGRVELGRSIFTMEDAVQAESGRLVAPGAKGNMLARFARNMLFNRAMSNGVRWYCPDVFMGAPVYTPDELGAEVDDEGTFINVTPTKIERPEQSTTSTTPTPATNGNGTGKRTLPSFKAETVQAVVADGHAEDIAAAVRRLNKSTVLQSNDDTQAVVLWAEMYATHRGVGLSSDDAAARADAEWSEAVAGAE